MSNSDLVLLAPYLDHIRKTERACIKIELVAAPTLAPWSSKVAGLPDLPLSHPYPCDQKGQPLALLAQINCADVPALTDFPQSGLLQFYIGSDDLYGCDLENQLNQDGFRVLFFSEVNTHVRRREDFSFLPPFKHLLPFETANQQAMKFTSARLPMSCTDYRFEATLPELSLAMRNNDHIDKSYVQFSQAAGHKIGGYPDFTQEDPRVRVEGCDFDLLFQLDTDDQAKIMWGDVGIGNFFIRNADLKKQDFSTVLYNWDCS